MAVKVALLLVSSTPPLLSTSLVDWVHLPLQGRRASTVHVSVPRAEGRGLLTGSCPSASMMRAAHVLYAGLARTPADMCADAAPTE